MRLAVIPARGGSKRIPRKNIRDFCGKPIIAWSIETALESKCFDAVIVSTDDPEIALIANEYGALTPFLRPESLADDHTATVLVIAHAIDWYLENRQQVEDVCCIYPTAPLLRPCDLAEGYELLKKTACDFVLSVGEFPVPMERALRIDSRARIEMIDPSCAGTRTQDLEKVFFDAGQFYWGKARAWLSGSSIMCADTVSYLLPSRRVQDIDSNDDWTKAELLFKLSKNFP